MAIHGLFVLLFCTYATVTLGAGFGAIAQVDQDSPAEYQSDGTSADEINSLKHEMRTLREELAAVRKNFDSKLQFGLQVMEAQVGDVARASDRSLLEITQRMTILAVDMRETKSFLISAIHDMRTDLDKETSSIRSEISELYSRNVEYKTNICNCSISAPSEGHANKGGQNFEHQLTTTNSQIQTLESKLLQVERHSDSMFKGLNTSIQAMESGIGLLKLVDANLELRINTLNATFYEKKSQEAEIKRMPRVGPLKLTVASTKLPTPVAYSSAVFDGQDSVYIIGGFHMDSKNSVIFNDKVLKYSLSSFDVKITSTFLELFGGSVVKDGDNIVYLGGRLSMETRRPGIYTISERGYSQVGSMPGDAQGMGCAWDSSTRTAYLFGGSTGGGHVDQILSYSATNNRITRLGSLPLNESYIAASWDSKRGVAHLFSGTDVWQFRPPNTLHSYDNPLPSILYDPCSVYASANDRVYVFGGGYKPIKYNPTNHTSTILDVENWPEFLSGAACVYIPKLHRILIFGGWGRYNSGEGNSRFRDEISFVDLD